MSLLPDKHPNGDLFIANIFDGFPSLKDDMATMEHPFFSLSTKPDKRTLRYESSAGYIEIIPSSLGLATIFDKDVLIFCASYMVQEMNAGRVPPKKIRITAHQILKSCNRPTNNLGYERLKAALDRLSGTRIKTSIETAGIRQINNFGLIDSYGIVEKDPKNERMVAIELVISDWFRNSIIGKEVLTISNDYFRLRKPIERRLYEIARKHCGKQKKWDISLDNLQKKVGSSSEKKWFRFTINKICNDADIPDYSIILDSKTDMVTFSQKGNATTKDQPCLPFDEMPRIHPHTIEKAKIITTGSGTGWDFYALQSEFTESLINGFKPEKVDGAFINFIKKKTAQRP